MFLGLCYNSIIFTLLHAMTPINRDRGSTTDCAPFRDLTLEQVPDSTFAPPQESWVANTQMHTSLQRLKRAPWHWKICEFGLTKSVLPQWSGEGRTAETRAFWRRWRVGGRQAAGQYLTLMLDPNSLLRWSALIPGHLNLCNLFRWHKSE